MTSSSEAWGPIKGLPCCRCKQHIADCLARWDMCQHLYKFGGQRTSRTIQSSSSGPPPPTPLYMLPVPI